jgi:CRISPR system Cascade subunit CasE
MLLHRIHLNPRCKEARRDLADPYQMHATLCRAFFTANVRCPPGALLWRLEPETDAAGCPRVLIQSVYEPDWSRIEPQNWLAKSDPGKPIQLEAIQAGQTFQFRLRANPCRTVLGKRQGLLKERDQRLWLERKGASHGFTLTALPNADYFEFAAGHGSQACPDLRITHDQMLIGRRHDGEQISVYSVLFEGRLTISDAERFCMALRHGIGHAKVMGLGMLSIRPA